MTGMEGKVNEQMPLLGNMKVRAYLVNLSIDWKMILTFSTKYEGKT